MKKYISIIVSILIIIGLAMTAYYLSPPPEDEQAGRDNGSRQQQQEGAQQSRLTDFEAALEADDSDRISGFLADEVNLILYGTECCGTIEKSRALDNLDYLDQVDTINFDQDQQVIKDIISDNPELGGYVWGKADNNEMVIGYKFDRENRVTDIYSAVDSNLLLDDESTAGNGAKEDSDGEPICRDMCGDGTCQEIVCLGTGCPCAETAENCPQDCK